MFTTSVLLEISILSLSLLLGIAILSFGISFFLRHTFSQLTNDLRSQIYEQICKPFEQVIIENAELLKKVDAKFDQIISSTYPKQIVEIQSQIEKVYNFLVDVSPNTEKKKDRSEDTAKNNTHDLTLMNNFDKKKLQHDKDAVVGLTIDNSFSRDRHAEKQNSIKFLKDLVDNFIFHKKYERFLTDRPEERILGERRKFINDLMKELSCEQQQRYKSKICDAFEYVLGLTVDYPVPGDQCNPENKVKAYDLRNIKSDQIERLGGESIKKAEAFKHAMRMDQPSVLFVVEPTVYEGKELLQQGVVVEG